MSTILAGPPGTCCWTGMKHAGTPEGRIEFLGGLDTYISEPSANIVASGPHRKILLFFSDIFGPLYSNNQLLQDYFASCGFIVLGPDYFFGSFFQDEPVDHVRFAWAQSARAAAIEAFPKWMDAVKAVYGTKTTKYTAVGYCFGAPFVLDLAADGTIVAGAIAHPTFLQESHFEKITRPLFISCSEVDSRFPLEARRRAEDTLISNQSSYCFQVFSAFSSLDNAGVLFWTGWAKEESARGIKEWLLRFSSGIVNEGTDTGSLWGPDNTEFHCDEG